MTSLLVGVLQSHLCHITPLEQIWGPYFNNWAGSSAKAVVTTEQEKSIQYLGQAQSTQHQSNLLSKGENGKSLWTNLTHQKELGVHL